MYFTYLNKLKLNFMKGYSSDVLHIAEINLLLPYENPNKSVAYSGGKAKYVGVNDKTDIQKRKALKKELREKIKKGEITKEEMKAKMLEFDNKDIERELEKERIKNELKIIQIIAIEDNEILAENLKAIEQKINDILVERDYDDDNYFEVHIDVVKSLGWFQAKMSELQIPSTTFYLLDDRFPEEAGDIAKKNMGVKAFRYIEKRHNDIGNKKLAVKNTAVVSSSDYNELKDVYGNEVKIIEGKSLYNLAYINSIVNWILVNIEQNPKIWNQAFEYYMDKRYKSRN